MKETPHMSVKYRQARTLVSVKPSPHRKFFLGEALQTVYKSPVSPSLLPSSCDFVSSPLTPTVAFPTQQVRLLTNLF